MDMMSSIASYGSSPPLDLGKSNTIRTSSEFVEKTTTSGEAVYGNSATADVRLSPEGLAKSSGDAVAGVSQSDNIQETNPNNRSETEKLTPKEQAEEQRKEHEEELAKAAREEAKALMKSLYKQNIDLSFSVDKDLGDTVVSVMDRSTEDLIRQIPSEEFLEMSKRLREYTETMVATPDEKKDALKGLLLDAQV